MSPNGVAQIAFFLALITILTPPLGAYIASVLEGRSVPGVTRVLGPVERGIYRLVRVAPATQQGWRGYAAAVLIFNAAGFVVLYAILRLQGGLPLNPLDLPGMRWDLAFNTTASFVSNTSWQFYGGESSLSYFAQAAGIGAQSFISAATGLAVVAAVIRGFAPSGGGALGNFWVDVVRSTLYVLLPLAVILTLALGSQGVIQSFGDPVSYQTLEARTLGAVDENGDPITQTIPRGAVASQMSIRSLGTVGGGYFNTNSATPLESPTPLTNLLHMTALLLIPAALTSTFGRMVGSRRQGWALYWAMMVLVVGSIAIALPFEQRGSEVLQATGVELSAGADQAGGNMTDKEVRFGISSTTLFGIATTASSNGAANGGFDAWTAGGVAVPLTLISLGEVAFGGVGSGLYGMLLFVVIAVFIGGLMIGRTPEFLGKPIGAREIKLSLIGLLVMPIGLLVMLACAVTTHAGLASMLNAGPQGFAEAFYAYSSQWNNNGSAMAGYGGTEFATTLGGVAMLLGRFAPLFAALALAGALARRQVRPAGAGTLRTTTPTFVVLLIFVILLFGALNFVPALGLGPVAAELAGTPF